MKLDTVSLVALTWVVEVTELEVVTLEVEVVEETEVVVFEVEVEEVEVLVEGVDFEQPARSKLVITRARIMMINTFFIAYTFLLLYFLIGID